MTQPAHGWLREQLRGKVVAAALTPFRPDGTIARDAVAPYAASLTESGIGGLAVGAHTGRGARLPTKELAWLVGEFGAASGLPVVAGLALPIGASESALLTAAEQLRAAGAAALLVCPVAGGSHEATVRLHERLGRELGSPLIGFVLYERASGYQYDAALTAELTVLPDVVGVKLALLDDAITCQDLIAVVRRNAPDALILTGEDRMYGPSLMWGADSALVGIAAALPAWSTEVLDAWTHGDHPRFVRASARLDRLAAATFREPLEGYVQRMAWVAEWQGILPPEYAVDPHGPALPPEEKADLLLRCGLAAGAP